MNILIHTSLNNIDIGYMFDERTDPPEPLTCWLRFWPCQMAKHPGLTPHRYPTLGFVCKGQPAFSSSFHRSACACGPLSKNASIIHQHALLQSKQHPIKMKKIGPDDRREPLSSSLPRCLAGKAWGRRRPFGFAFSQCSCCYLCISMATCSRNSNHRRAEPIPPTATKLPAIRLRVHTSNG